MLLAAADGEAQKLAAGEASGRKLQSECPIRLAGVRRRGRLITRRRDYIRRRQAVRQSCANGEWHASGQESNSRKDIAEVGIGGIDSIVSTSDISAFGRKPVRVERKRGNVPRSHIADGDRIGI